MVSSTTATASRASTTPELADPRRWSHHWRTGGPITGDEMVPSHWRNSRPGGPIPLAGDTMAGAASVEGPAPRVHGRLEAADPEDTHVCRYPLRGHLRAVYRLRPECRCPAVARGPKVSRRETCKRVVLGSVLLRSTWRGASTTFPRRPAGHGGDVRTRARSGGSELVPASGRGGRQRLGRRCQIRVSALGVCEERSGLDLQCLTASRTSSGTPSGTPA
jgi:hypothetical protein